MPHATAAVNILALDQSTGDASTFIWKGKSIRISHIFFTMPLMVYICPLTTAALMFFTMDGSAMAVIHPSDI